MWQFGIGPVEVLIVLVAAILMGIIPSWRSGLPWVLTSLIVAAIATPGGDPWSMIIIGAPLVAGVLYVRRRLRGAAVTN